MDCKTCGVPGVSREGVARQHDSLATSSEPTVCRNLKLNGHGPPRKCRRIRHPSKSRCSTRIVRLHKPEDTWVYNVGCALANRTDGSMIRPNLGQHWPIPREVASGGASLEEHWSHGSGCATPKPLRFLRARHFGSTTTPSRQMPQRVATMVSLPAFREVCTYMVMLEARSGLWAATGEDQGGHKGCYDARKQRSLHALLPRTITTNSRLALADLLRDVPHVRCRANSESALFIKCLGGPSEKRQRNTTSRHAAHSVPQCAERKCSGAPLCAREEGDRGGTTDSFVLCVCVYNPPTCTTVTRKLDKVRKTISNPESSNSS